MTAKRLRKQNKYAKVICVILKDNFFKRYSHQKKLINATNITSEIYDISKGILKEFYKGEKIRLIGLRLDDLVSENIYQTSLFEDLDNKYKESSIDKVMDDINKKLGYNKVVKASMCKNNINRKM